MENSLNPVGRLSTWYQDKPAIQALLKLVPGGGSADTLLQRRANEIKVERLKEFFDELAKGNIPLSEEQIESEDFLHSYFCTLSAVTNTRQREKIRLFARLLQSTLEPSLQTNPDECEELISTLEDITLREFAVLNALYRLEQTHPPPVPGAELQIISLYWNAFQNVATELHDLPLESLNAFMARLERTGLYLRITGAFLDYSGDRGRTTPLFARLLEFVKDEADHTPPAASM